MSGRALVFLDPARARLTRDGVGLALDVDGTRHEKLTPRRAYPWSAPSAFIALLDDKEETVAMIEDAALLDEPSRRAVDEALSDLRFLPMIQRIDQLTFNRNLYLWEVQTDRGPRTFRTSHGWGEEPVRRAQSGGVLVTATDGVRFRLADLATFSERERELLSTIV